MCQIQTQHHKFFTFALALNFTVLVVYHFTVCRRIAWCEIANNKQTVDIFIIKPVNLPILTSSPPQPIFTGASINRSPNNPTSRLLHTTTGTTLCYEPDRNTSSVRFIISKQAKVFLHGAPCFCAYIPHPLLETEKRYETATEVDTARSIKIRQMESRSLFRISHQEILHIGRHAPKRTDCHRWVPKSRLLHVSSFTVLTSEKKRETINKKNML